MIYLLVPGSGLLPTPLTSKPLVLESGARVFTSLGPLTALRIAATREVRRVNHDRPGLLGAGTATPGVEPPGAGITTGLNDPAWRSGMLTQVCVDEDGAVTVLIDSSEDADDDTRTLVGLQLDDMLQRAAETAVTTWLRIRTEGDE